MTSPCSMTHGFAGSVRGKYPPTGAMPGLSSPQRFRDHNDRDGSGCLCLATGYPHRRVGALDRAGLAMAITALISLLGYAMDHS